MTVLNDIDNLLIIEGGQRRVIRGNVARRRPSVPMSMKLKMNEARAMNKMRNKYRIKINAAKQKEAISMAAKSKIRGSR